MKHATEVERQTWCWLWAKRFFTRWHSMHGIAGQEEAWAAMDEWEQGYWYGVAEFVYENFDEKLIAEKEFPDVED
jgi:hypothetical protein